MTSMPETHPMMRLKHAKTLITGKPGVGKTTVVQKVIDRMGPVRIAGFFTTEIRPRRSRLGFQLQGLNGRRRTLAHVDLESPYRVGKYGVDTAGFEAFLETLDLLNPEVGLIVIDEIGKMELFSSRFRTLVSDALNSETPLLASVPLKGGVFIREIKQRSDVHLVEVTPGNRDHLPETILEKG
jgi:nucleoside-triphosphatase